MPHVVIEGSVDPGRLFEELEPVHEAGSHGVRRTGEIFLNRRRDTSLLEAVVVERGLRQRFFVLISRKGAGVTVRLEPSTQPEKTEGVKRLLAAVGRRVRTHFPDTRYGQTNLADCLDA